MRIGLDFDNTIVNYNYLVHDIAVKRNLINKNFKKDKKFIKEHLISLNKEREWREIQSLIYGKEIFRAKLFNNFSNFIKECRKNNYFLQIVSHKTEVSNLTNNGPRLRQNAIEWMNRNKFFSNFRFKISDIHFENTKSKKIDRINFIGFDYFIDDLEEIFLNKKWPYKTTPILFNKKSNVESDKIILCNSWNNIYKFFFKKNILV
ncbi:MAG: hypothetical protein CMM49_06805 [Rhodospirillaceae bacterium]|nr:hypothetical protein [Rhodospirillaceae bacterium]|tara:strand:- start:133 stop:747 length:615 start_codon:yes stop_codon:yes gene_type:complete